jgi:Flp pilus assembly protein TadG
MSGRRARRQRGSELFEFTLVSFQLFLVVFAGIEFCRMVLVYTSIASAARAGVRYASVNGADDIANAANTPATAANICAAVTSFTTGLNTSAFTCGGGSGSYIDVTWPDGNSYPGSRVQVTVVYVYDPFFSILPLQVNLGSTSIGYIMY